MAAVRNILFIMCDQLRADHLGCYGHPYLATKNLDALAARGVRFDRAFVQSGVCGPSRMSFYTGRYMSSHGATWNRVPLSVGEITLGEYLRGAGRTLALSGKTHVLSDTAGLARLQLDGDAELGRLLAGASSSSTATTAISRNPEARMRRTCAGAATPATIRGRNTSSAPPTTTAGSCPAGTCRTPICPRASPSPTRKRRTPPIARSISSARRASARGYCTFRT
jgi:hypothetical protein